MAGDRRGPVGLVGPLLAVMLVAGGLASPAQLDAYSSVEVNLVATFAGSAVVPGPADPDAAGSAVISVTPSSGQLMFIYTATGLTLPTAAHIHAGAAGVNGPILFTLQTPPADGSEAGPGGFFGDSDLIQDMADHPENYYIDVHSAEFPDGAARGQLAQGRYHVSSYLYGAPVVPGPGDPHATATLTMSVDVAAGEICPLISPTDLGAPTAAEVHLGAAGTSGPSVLTLQPGYDPAVPRPCTAGYDPALLQAMLDDTGSYYVEVATDSFPDGAIRGQLVLGTGGIEPPPGTCAAGTLCNGFLQPGTYTYRGFATPLTFTTPTRLRAIPLVDADPTVSGALGLLDPAGGGELGVFHFTGKVYSDGCTIDETTIPDSPASLMAHLAQHPYLATTPPVAVSYGGAPGLQTDVTVLPVPDCLTHTTPLLPRTTWVGTGSGTYEEGTTMRIVAQRVGSQTIVSVSIELPILQVAETGRVQGGPSFIDQSQAVVDTYRWSLAGSGTPTVSDTATAATQPRTSVPSLVLLAVLGGTLIASAARRRALDAR